MKAEWVIMFEAVVWLVFFVLFAIFVLAGEPRRPYRLDVNFWTGEPREQQPRPCWLVRVLRWLHHQVFSLACWAGVACAAKYLAGF